jgi:hypothetical protein
MHEPMLNGNVQQSVESEAIALAPCIAHQLVVEGIADLANVLADTIERGPVRSLIGRQSSPDWVDAKGKQSIKLWMETSQAKHVLVQKIPVKRFQVADIEDNPVAFGNWAIIHSLRLHDLKQRVAPAPGVGDSSE